MANATAKSVMRQAILQTGYTESGRNHTKFGKDFGMDGVSWCAIYEWWCGYKAQGDNPIARNASAAYIQDDTVAKGGSWVMRKTASNETKKAALAKARFGDIASFDFGKNNNYRYHTGFIIGVSGNYYFTMEGNTSSEGRAGSQHNGDCVALRLRHYSMVCSIVRPAYGKQEKYAPDGPYKGRVPELKKGSLKVGSKGINVKRLQRAVNWASGAKVEVDGVFGTETLFGVIWFQHTYGLVTDGEFAEKSLAKLNAVINAHGDKPEKPAKKTKAEKIIEKAVEYAYPKGTAKAKYEVKTGKPTPEYKRALDKIFQKHKSWKKEIRNGASCAVFVATAIRSSGVDKKFMCDDPPKTLSYMDKSAKWIKLNRGRKPLPLKEMKPGDVIAYEKVGAHGNGHILLYKGDGYCVEANFGRCYPHTLKIPKAYLNENYIKNTYRQFAVYRVKE